MSLPVDGRVVHEICTTLAHLDHDGSVLAELWNDEGFVAADVNPAAALEHRQTSMYFASLRPDLYARYDV